MRLIEKGEPMNPRGRFPTLAALVVLSSSASYGATIIGTVTGPDGTALEGVFVQAQNHNANMIPRNSCAVAAAPRFRRVNAQRQLFGPIILNGSKRQLTTISGRAPPDPSKKIGGIIVG
jgi:hypothetical protein